VRFVHAAAMRGRHFEVKSQVRAGRQALPAHLLHVTVERSDRVTVGREEQFVYPEM